MQVKDFAPLLRLKNLLEEKEVQLEISQNDNLLPEFKKFEAIIVTLEVVCFKHRMPADQFFECVKELYLLYDKLGTSAKDLPDYLVQLEHHIKSQKKELNRLRIETKKEVEGQGATMELLREYLENIHMAESTKRELEKVTRERDSCRKELDIIRERNGEIVFANTEDEYGWHVG